MPTTEDIFGNAHQRTQSKTTPPSVTPPIIRGRFIATISLGAAILGRSRPRFARVPPVLPARRLAAGQGPRSTPLAGHIRSAAQRLFPNGNRRGLSADVQLFHLPVYLFDDRPASFRLAERIQGGLLESQFSSVSLAVRRSVEPCERPEGDASGKRCPASPGWPSMAVFKLLISYLSFSATARFLTPVAPAAAALRSCSKPAVTLERPATSASGRGGAPGGNLVAKEASACVGGDASATTERRHGLAATVSKA